MNRLPFFLIPIFYILVILIVNFSLISCSDDGPLPNGTQAGLTGEEGDGNLPPPPGEDEGNPQDPNRPWFSPPYEGLECMPDSFLVDGYLYMKDELKHVLIQEYAQALRQRGENENMVQRALSFLERSVVRQNPSNRTEWMNYAANFYQWFYEISPYGRDGYVYQCGISGPMGEQDNDLPEVRYARPRYHSQVRFTL